jgi:hypothetical protein
MRFFFIFLFVQISVFSQKQVFIFDVETRNPLKGVIILNNEQFTIQPNGSIISNNTKDSILIKSLGYYTENRYFYLNQDTIWLKKYIYQLPEAYIVPEKAKNLIIKSLENYFKTSENLYTHQDGVYREAFYSNNEIIKMQEIDFETQLKPILKDSRPYYKSNNNVIIKNVFAFEDSIEKNKIKDIIGNRVASRVQFDVLSFYTFIKSRNILNRVYTYLLNPDPKYIVNYQIEGSDFFNGQEVYKIKIIHTYKDFLFTESFLYISKEDYAIMYFDVLSNENVKNKSVFDLKTRFGMWLLGINIEISQYYAKLIFRKNESQTNWLNEVLFTFPTTFTRNSKTLNLLAQVKYRLNEPLIIKPNEYIGNTSNKIKSIQSFKERKLFKIPLNKFEDKLLQKIQ